MALSIDQKLAKIAETHSDSDRRFQLNNFRDTILDCYPSLWKQLEIVASSPAVFQLWGRSKNFDENAKKTIVSKKILNGLLRLVGQIPLKRQVANAGLLHTYGYLFSLIKTPFGLKRKRWIDPTICNGFGLTQKELCVNTSKGTLIGNLSYFLAKISYPRNHAAFHAWKKWESLVADSLTQYPFEKLNQHRRIVRTNCYREGSKINLVVVYDLIPFPKKRTSKKSHLLIYSIGTNLKERKLITAFTTTEEFAETILLFPKEQKVSEAPLRFNAAFDQ